MKELGGVAEQGEDSGDGAGGFSLGGGRTVCWCVP